LGGRLLRDGCTILREGNIKTQFFACGRLFMSPSFTAH
jgi:hypothetical protein